MERPVAEPVLHEDGDSALPSEDRRRLANVHAAGGGPGVELARLLVEAASERARLPGSEAALENLFGYFPGSGLPVKSARRRDDLSPSRARKRWPTCVDLGPVLPGSPLSQSRTHARSSRLLRPVVGDARGPRSCYNSGMSSRNAVLAEALQLPPEERADVAKRLIASLDGPADEDVEAAWLAEVERRLQDVDRGTAKVEPWDAVRERLAARLRANRK